MNIYIYIYIYIYIHIYILTYTCSFLCIRMYHKKSYLVLPQSLQKSEFVFHDQRIRISLPVATC